MFSKIELQPCQFGHPKGDKNGKPAGLSETSRFPFSSGGHGEQNGSHAPAEAVGPFGCLPTVCAVGYFLPPLPGRPGFLKAYGRIEAGNRVSSKVLRCYDQVAQRKGCFRYLPRGGTIPIG